MARSCKLTREQIDEAVASYVAGESSSDIAARYGVSAPSIVYHVRKRGHAVRSKSKCQPSRVPEAVIDEMERLYVEEELNTYQVGDLLGVVQSTVFNCLSRRGIKLREHVKRRKLTEEQRDELARLYVDERKTYKDLEALFGVSNTVIRSVLKERGIRPRRGWASHRVVEWVDRLGREWLFKSEWERAYAEFLDRAEFDWEYEPRTYRLSEHVAYTPDFEVRLLGRTVLVEVKGWLDEVTEDRMAEFLREYPDEELLLVGPAEMAELELVSGYYREHPMADRVDGFRQRALTAAA